MIINKIRLQEEYPSAGVSDSWPFPVCDLNLNSTSGENGYILKQVEGLEPPELTEVVEGFDIAGIPAIIDIPKKRELVLKIGLSPKLDQSYGDLRDALYKLMSRTICIKLMYDSLVVAQVIGHVRRFENTLFSNKPEVQVTIECKTGQLDGPKSVAIPSVALNTANPIINYEEGTAPTGLDLVIKVIASQAGFSITNHGRVYRYNNELSNNKFELTYPLLSGDQITVSTHPGLRRLTLLRASVTTDLAGYLNAGAVWPLLYPGVNTFTWTLLSSWVNWTTPPTSTLNFTPRFWGV